MLVPNPHRDHFPRLSSARGNAALVRAEESVQLLREGSVKVSAALPSFPDKAKRSYCAETAVARFNLSVEKVLCFFSPRPGFSGVSWFAGYPAVCWLGELSACSESLPEFPRTAEAFSGSIGWLLCSSGEGQTSFRVPRTDLPSQVMMFRVSSLLTPM